MLPDFHDYSDMRAHPGHSDSPLEIKLHALPNRKRVFHSKGPPQRHEGQRLLKSHGRPVYACP
jgi:hypothetical protein